MLFSDQDERKAIMHAGVHLYAYISFVDVSPRSRVGTVGIMDTMVSILAMSRRLECR